MNPFDADTSNDDCDHSWETLTDYGIKEGDYQQDSVKLRTDDDGPHLVYGVPAERRVECTECGETTIQTYSKRIKVSAEEVDE